jgi:flagellar biosynthesis/type III secretory pathway protein FliH
MSLSPDTRTVQVGRILRGIQFTQVNAQNGSSENTTAATRAEVAAAFEAGRKKGREDALRELAPTAVALKQMLDALQSQTHDVTMAVDKFSTRLAVRIAAKVIEREVTDPQTVAGMISVALAQAPLTGNVTIRLHPLDVAIISNFVGKVLPNNVAIPREAVLVSDPTVKRGGCIVDSGVGRLDARIETQLAAIERALSSYPERSSTRG